MSQSHYLVKWYFVALIAIVQEKTVKIWTQHESEPDIACQAVQPGFGGSKQAKLVQYTGSLLV